MPVIHHCKLCKEREARQEEYGMPYCNKCIPLIDYIKRTEYEIQNEVNKISKGRIYIQIKLMEDKTIMEELNEIVTEKDKLKALLDDEETEEIRRQALEDEYEWKVENGLIEPADEDMVREGERGYGSDYEERLRNQNPEKV